MSSNTGILEKPLSPPPGPRDRSVLTLGPAQFESACGDLLRIASLVQAPDLIVGIRTGGLHVAEAMARSVGGTVPVLALTCRRPSTAKKERSTTFRRLATKLPRPVLDRLRVFEHRMLTRNPPPREPSRMPRVNVVELNALEAWLATAPANLNILIVDDAVDSGATLVAVNDAVRSVATGAATIRTAAVTVTTENPLAYPDYSLHSLRLCRFPWSFDA
jgi:hypoxanthine phosphoribosyltransferase